MDGCSVEGCGKAAVARGWCPKHWWRWRNHGSPNVATVYDFTPEQRFWQKVCYTADDVVYPDAMPDCWIWTGARRGDGYGAFQVGRQQIAAHRYSYALNCGEIPDGMVVMHSCDVPLCVNPAHLRLGTNADNCADAARKGRRLPGSQNHQAKLTEAQVIEMRLRYADGGITQIELASDYGVSKALVSFILTRKAWKHI